MVAAARVFVCSVLVGLCAAPAYAFSSGIASTQFGSAGCNDCHSGGNRPDVTLDGPSVVAPGTTNQYTLQIFTTGAQDKGGLTVSATAGALTVGGTAASATRTVVGGGGALEITHAVPKAAAGGTVSFTFVWTAPSVAGPVTMRGWGNAVDGSASPAGDRADTEDLNIVVDDSAPATTCEAAPLVGCRTPTKAGAASLQLKDNVNDAKDALAWTWAKGAATLLTDFGDPVNGSTAYTLCVYAALGGVPELVVPATVPAGRLCVGTPCWRATKTGFLFKDKDLKYGGIAQITLKAGVAGKASVVVKAKGANVPVPAPTAAGLLAQDPTVVVQLKNSEGVCWAASYSAPATKNDATQFKDKSD